MFGVFLEIDKGQRVLRTRTRSRLLPPIRSHMSTLCNYNVFSEILDTLPDEHFLKLT